MNIGEYSVENKVVSWLIIVIMLGGGFYAFNSMGKLEDPAFTIKSAKHSSCSYRCVQWESWVIAVNMTGLFHCAALKPLTL